MNLPLSIRPLARPLLASFLGLGLLIPAHAQKESVLEVNMHSDLKICESNLDKRRPAFWGYQIGE